MNVSDKLFLRSNDVDVAHLVNEQETKQKQRFLQLKNQKETSLAPGF